MQEQLGALAARIATLEHEREAWREEVSALQQEAKLLRIERDLYKERVAAFKRQLFDAKSEQRRAPEGHVLQRSRSAAPTASPRPKVEVPAHQRAKRGRKPLDPALPREVRRHELPEDERVCPHDGARLSEIGVEVSEQLDIVPQQVRVIRHERVKYACPCCDGGLRLAAKPAQVIPKGLLSESALAWVITSKYLDGLPLYRQAVLLGRFGGTELSRNTLAASVVRVGQAVQPVVNLLRDALLDSFIVHGDETEVQVLKEPGRKAQAKSYMWVQMSRERRTGPPIRLFGYSPSRSTQRGQDTVRGHAARRRADERRLRALRGHRRAASARAPGLLGALPAVLQRCAAGVAQGQARAGAIAGALHRAHRPAVQASRPTARRDKLEARKPRAAQQQRKLHSAPVLEQIEALALQHLHGVLPGSLLGKALHYLTAQWPKLVRYVDDGRYPIDNNACENAIRPFVVGRRNWLFADTVAGANASANLYSLLQTCLANGIEPYRYLPQAARALPKARTVDDYEALLPWNITPAA